MRSLLCVLCSLIGIVFLASFVWCEEGCQAERAKSEVETIQIEDYSYLIEELGFDSIEKVDEDGLNYLIVCIRTPPPSSSKDFEAQCYIADWYIECYKSGEIAGYRVYYEDGSYFFMDKADCLYVGVKPYRDDISVEREFIEGVSQRFAEEYLKEQERKQAFDSEDNLIFDSYERCDEKGYDYVIVGIKHFNIFLLDNTDIEYFVVDWFSILYREKKFVGYKLHSRADPSDTRYMYAGDYEYFEVHPFYDYTPSAELPKIISVAREKTLWNYTMYQTSGSFR